MSTLPITVEQIPAISDIQSSMDGSEMQREAIKYEHGGYQIRVHFGGDKTFYNVSATWQSGESAVDFLWFVLKNKDNERQ